ncbi:PorT family protein [Inquilinus sp. KBS0705]|nr:PorT family protein [Inquilinus sp. KBS0705]
MMKNLLKGLLFSMMLFGNQIYAQDTIKTPKTYLDPLLNLISTNLNYGDANSKLSDYKNSILGAQLGASFQAGITPAFSLVSELYFTGKGGKLKESNPLTIRASTIRLYAFELPVLARFCFSEFHLNAGPSIAYNFYGTRNINDKTGGLTFDSSANGFERFEAGLQAGGGYTFHTKTKRITLDLRYNYGLTNISNGQEMYNRSFIVSIHVSKAWKRNPFASHKNN